MESLYKLLKEYKVEIPVIQRDYVQGRKEPQIEKIRIKFIEDLLKSVKSEGVASQHLDFIYGRITDDLNTEGYKKNAESVEQLLFILKKYHSSLGIPLTGELPSVNKLNINDLKKKVLPLDGQQRLTTLWLFHFVIAHQIGIMPSWMQNFTYKTRKSSRDFCSKLLEEQENLIVCESYSEIIENQHWFFYKWKNDPTIKGMLVMLDEIWRQICLDKNWHQHLDRYWDNLISNKVVFSFLPLNEKNIDDEIYIKMNARGKPLSDFEKFKNQLLHFLDSNTNEKKLNQNRIKEYAHRLDTNWLDLFWESKRSQTYKVQTEYFNFFKIFLLYNYILNTVKEVVDQELIKLFLQNKDDKSRYEDLSFSELVIKNVVTVKNILKVFETLDLFKESDKINQFITWLDEQGFQYDNKSLNGNNKLDILKSHFTYLSKDLNYYDRTYIMSLLYFIEYFGLSSDNIEFSFKSYSRTCYNIIYNQNYIQNPDTFIIALRTIKKVSQMGDSIHKYLQETDFNSIRFKNSLLEEEIIKYNLIESNPDLEREFIIAEKHEYFRGQIGFILKMSGDKDNFDLAKFKDYRDKLMILFSERFRVSDHRLFERALLSKKNYFIDKGHSRWMFCDPNNGLRAKEEGWRIVFQKNAKEIQLILDNISLGTIENDLLQIIHNYTGNNWRKYFITSPKLWSSCDKRFIKKTDDNYKVRLLKNNNAGGTQREIRTKYFQIRYLELDPQDYHPFETIKYVDAKKQDEIPCAYFTNWYYEEKNYFLDVRFEKREYELNFSYREQDISNISFDSKIVSCLQKFKYQKSNKYGYESYILSLGEVDSTFYKHINDLLKCFSSLLNGSAQ